MERQQIKIIKSKALYKTQTARLFELMEEEPKYGSPAYDEMELLALLVASYENKQPQVSTPTPVEAIKFAMEQRGYTQTDLANLLGSKSRASEILNEKRSLTLDNIYILHSQWQIPLESLINEGAVKRGKKGLPDQKQTGIWH